MAYLSRGLVVAASLHYLKNQEQHRHRLVQPLHVKVADAAGKIAEYEYCPESDEELNTFHASDSPESRSYRMPVLLHIIDAKGTCVEVLTELAPLPEWLNIAYPEGAKA
jgi:hypothetical protein